jgi:hypothetical protein
MSREFAEKPQAVPGLFLSRTPESTRESKKFPVFSLMIREFDPEKGSIQTASSATQSVGFAFSQEMAANSRVDGPIRTARRTGESE